HYLERLDDCYSPFGCGQVIYSAGSPVIDPLFDTKPSWEIVMDLCQAMDIDPGYKSLEKMMQHKAEKLGGKWKSISDGQAYTSEDNVFQYQVSLPRELGASALENPGNQHQLSLAPLGRMRFGNRLIAIPPFATVTIQETELSAQGFFVQMNSATAFKHNLKQDQSITLTSEAGSIQGLVNINEGVMDDVVAVPAGFGHTAWDQFSRGKGDNVFKLLKVAGEKGSDALTWNRTRVDIA
ncbi:MAG: molybdopterin dinucleotide binding domain-containing protein, partial [Desulfonatronovibrionaceae bacterium]